MAGFAIFKSKYRLNKGDQQMELMYESSLPSLDQDADLRENKHTPHHITGMLTDITYYVYKSRRTPKSVLCTHVRRNWVPGEYPSSMQRMQEWTPDECIPEFFCDPEIFKSIHEDLPDLEVPVWCQNGENFIQWHRSVLESDHASERIHRWIDITFGYKLSGSAAKKSMNVFLPVMDNHTIPVGHGIVQLFHSPHPKKLTPSPYMATDAPNIPRTKLKAPVGVGDAKRTTVHDEFVVSTADIASDVLVTSEAAAPSSSSTQADQIPPYQSDASEPIPSFDVSVESVESSMEKGETSAINRLSTGPDVMQLLTGDDIIGIKNPIKKLPFFRQGEEMNIFCSEGSRGGGGNGEKWGEALSQVEALFSFTSKSLHGVPVPSKQATFEENFDKLVERDMLALGCTIAELFLASKLRAQYPRQPLEQRKNLILRALTTDWMEIPRPCRDVLQLLLKIDVSSSRVCHPVQPFTCNFLLSPYSEIVAFPPFFPALHQLAKELSEADTSIARLDCLTSLDPSFTSEMNDLKRRKVHIARRWMPEVLVDLNEEGKEILLLYLLDLFNNHEIGLLALLLLFNKLAQFLGPQKTAKHCLPIIKSIFEMDHSSSHFILIYHRPFLSQLLVRLGCRIFLRHLAQYVVMATNGLKDCPIHSIEDESWIHNGFSQNSAADTVSFTSQYGCDGKKDLSYEEDVFDLTGINRCEDRADQFVDDEEQSDGEDMSLSEEDRSESISLNSLPTNPDATSVSSIPFINDVVNDDAERSSGDDEVTDKYINMPQDDESRTQEEDSNSRRGTSPDAERNSSDGERRSLDEERRSSNGSNSLAVDGNVAGSFQSHSSKNGRHSPNVDTDMVGEKEDNREHTLTPDLLHTRHSNLYYPVGALPDLPVNVSLSEVSCQSVSWLAERIGPSLTGQYLTVQLLEALTQCYASNHAVDHPESESLLDVDELYINGDSYARGVLQCIMDIVDLYGDEFIFQQCLPFIENSVACVKKKVLMKHEASLVASMVLLTSILERITERQLHEVRKVITKKILFPVINLSSSLSHIFPSGASARNALCRKLVAAITTLALRLGRERGRNELKMLLNKFLPEFRCD
ncbi:putative WD repeat-containing protein 81 [Apostichopus japonicus]|uniref:Putative WD repeat-containing protein 81 n=1 Tax=Stichopus japonicus TaxID=307972 RepID=A0A2G8LMJ4_STIJA|nr:putative WD repeat-containing protein 81 [Apostichopus japonicus]